MAARNFYVRSWTSQYVIESFRTIIYDDHNHYYVDMEDSVPAGFKRAFHVKAVNDEQVYLVDEDDLVRILPPEGKYETYDGETISRQKVEMNSLWLSFCDGVGHRTALLLDGPLGVTSGVCVRSGLFESITVTNYMKNFAQRFPKDLLEHVRIYPGALYEYLLDQGNESSHELDVAMDYCCSFYGSETGVKPMADLHLLFHTKRLRAKKGVLWLTFSIRSRGNSADRTLQDVRDYIHSLSNASGYVVTLRASGTYFHNSTMCYFFYTTG